MTTTTCARPACDRTPITGAKGYCRKHAYVEGTLTPFVDAAPTRRIFQQAQQDGHSIATIAEATGVSYGSVFRVLNGTSARVRKITEDRARQFSGNPNRMESWPLTRRVQSLLAAGHDMTSIAAECGVSRETISHLAYAEHPTVLWRVGEAVLDYWKAHETDPVGRPHPLALKHGWIVPLMWDDVDDPDESHEVETSGVLRTITDRDLVALDTLVRRHGQAVTAEQVGLSLAALKSIRGGAQERTRRAVLDRAHELAVAA